MRLACLAFGLAACAPAHRTELHLDFDGDGRLDRGVLIDERDGFRHTFAYLEMDLATGHHETAKWKDGHWIWVDLADYPALSGHTLSGLLLALAVAD